MANNFTICPTFRCTEVSINSTDQNLCRKKIPLQILLNIAEKIYNFIPIAEHNRNRVIGIVAEKSSLLISAIIGIIKSGNAFAIFHPGPFDYLERQFYHFKISRAFFDYTGVIEKKENFQHIDGSFFVSEFKENFTEDVIFNSKILYAIQTSGSTGEPKIVHVPYESIMPNILDFIKRFFITDSSSVLFSTPLNFDPSMVELLTAMHVGAELIIPKFGWMNIAMGKMLTQLNISFIQITPAVIKCLPLYVLTHLFGPHSKVQSMLIGGENFPFNLIKYYMNETTQMKVYNIYGITEVSCWASCYEFTLDDAHSRGSNQLIPIGVPLLDTKLGISEEGVLMIYGRECYVNFCRQKSPTQTGDIAFMNNEQIFVKSRFKPNSQLPAIELEYEIMNIFPEIISTKMVFLNECRFLFLDHLDRNSSISTIKIRDKIPKTLWPTRIFWNICIQSHFLTSNGKLDDKRLCQFIKNHYCFKSASLLDFLQQNYAISINHHLDTPMCHLGIGSLEAAEISFLLTNSTKSTTTFGEIMQFIIDEKNTLGKFIENFGFQQINNLPAPSSRSKYETNSNVTTAGKFILEEIWQTNLGKCIDGTPVHSSDGVIYAASHQGILKGINISNGETILEYLEQDDRFEAGCQVNGEYIAIGGFSGNMLVFDKTSRKEPKYFIKCGDEIRMVPLFDGNLIYWGTYRGNVWKLDILSNESTQIQSLKYGPLRSTPLLYCQYLIFGTLDGYLISLDKLNGEVIWNLELDSPIFASPTSIETNCFCLTVKGVLNSIEITTGQIVDSLSFYDQDSTFFDSPTFLEPKFMLVPAGKNHLYLVEYAPKLAFLKQIFMPESVPIVRQPVIVDNYDIFILNTKGGLFHFSKASLFHSNIPTPSKLLQLNAETFGHPLIIKQQKMNDTSITIAIGTRADLLHCFSATLDDKNCIRE